MRHWFNLSDPAMEGAPYDSAAMSRMRAKVEHSIGIIKPISGFQRVRCRGLAKNLHRLEVIAALANLFVVRRQLLRLQG